MAGGSLTLTPFPLLAVASVSVTVEALEVAEQHRYATGEEPSVRFIADTEEELEVGPVRHRALRSFGS